MNREEFMCLCVLVYRSRTETASDEEARGWYESGATRVSLAPSVPPLPVDPRLLGSLSDSPTVGLMAGPQMAVTRRTGNDTRPDPRPFAAWAD